MHLYSPKTEHSISLKTYRAMGFKPLRVVFIPVIETVDYISVSMQFQQKQQFLSPEFWCDHNKQDIFVGHGQPIYDRN